MKKIWIAVFLIIPALHGFCGRNEAMRLIGEGFQKMESDPFAAQEKFVSAISFAPDWDYPYVLLADLYDRYFLFDKAIASYEKAISLGLTQRGFIFQIYFRLGILYIKNGNIAEAEKYLDRAEAISPGKINREKESLTLLKEAVSLKEQAFQEEEEKIKPDNTSTKKTSTSKKKAKPSKKDPRENTEMIYNDQLEQAISLLQKVILQEKDWIYAFHLLGESFEFKRDWESAEDIYKKALNLIPVKNLVLSGDAPGIERGGYYFVRDTAEKGKWTLDIQLPAGQYRYCFYQNFLLVDEKRHLDKNNKLTVQNARGELFNTLKVSEPSVRRHFEFYTLPRSGVFDHFESRYRALRLSKAGTGRKEDQLLYGESLWGERKEFRYYNPHAFRVWIIGSFNTWGRDKSGAGNYEYLEDRYWVMQGPDTNGVWFLDVNLDAGIYNYNFVLDETYIIKDPEVDIAIAGEYSNVSDLLWRDSSVMKVGEMYDVTFKFVMTNAKSVWLAGEFNNWGGTSIGKKVSAENSVVMTGPDKAWAWTTTIRLTKGRYTYKFITDGKYWNQDPMNPLSDQSDNSIVYVGRQYMAKGEYVGMNETNGAEVVFRYETGEMDTKEVWVIGDFNDWGGKNAFKEYLQGYYYPMKKIKTDKDKMVWEFRIKLSPGKYRYKYLINQKKRIDDPNAKNFEKMPGGKNVSVLIVPEGKQKGGK